MTTNLIIGGTGKTGRRVLSLLQHRDLPVTPLSRPEFDWSEPATWVSAERPADSAYLTFAPDLAFPGAAEAVADVTDRMARSGARRIVLLSGRGEPAAQRAEELFAEAAGRHGATWGVVRCAFFLQNFDESLFAEPLTAGHVAFPAGDVEEPFVDLDDVAEVAVGMMTGEVAADRVYELTGPRLLTFAAATEAIASTTGRRIDYEQVPTSSFVADLVGAGLPPEEAAGLGALFAEILDGRNAHLAGGVREALGREPRDITEYAARAAAGGAWGAVV